MINHTIFRLSLLLSVIMLFGGCSSECTVSLFMRFENTLDADVEITYRTNNIYYGESPIYLTETIPANETRDIVSQTFKNSPSGISIGGSCEDDSLYRAVEISSDSLSMYTFCATDGPYVDGYKIRILEIARTCNENENKITSGY